MGELANRVRAKFPGSYDDLNDQQLEAAVLAKHPEYKDLTGAAPQPQSQQAPQFKPGFAEGVSGATIGVDSPESLTAAEDAGKITPSTLLLGPAGMAGRMIKDYASNLYDRGKTAMQDAYDAGQNIGNGQPVGQNIGKAALGGYQALNAAIPFVGEQANKVGEDVAKKNYGSAFGRGLATLATVGIGGEKGGLEHPEIQQTAARGAARAGVEAVLQPVGKQFRFGKDPTGFVIDNGITANSLEELHNKISSTVDAKSTELDGALKQSPATVNLSAAKKVVADAMKDAMQQRDAATVGKLTDLYQRLNSRIVPGQASIKSMPSPNSVPAWEAAQVKRGIQKSINWAESADKPVNDVKLQVQHVIADGLHTAVPETAALDESISSGIEAQKAAEKQWLNQQAGRRTVRYGTRVPLVGGAIGGAIGGTPGAAIGATIGRGVVQGMAEPAIGTRLGTLGKRPPAETPYPR